MLILVEGVGMLVKPPETDEQRIARYFKECTQVNELAQRVCVARKNLDYVESHNGKSLDD